MNSNGLKINASWTLFLDRDGVINRRIVNGYVKSWDQFEFLPGVLDAVAEFSAVFGRIIVVSNQQGVGKGLMTADEVEAIHHQMKREMEEAGGRIDAIYFCPFLGRDHSILRKPKIGMALKARKEFPEIRFKKSVMVGDSISDMVFGKRLGMVTIFTGGEQKAISTHDPVIDFAFDDLHDFVQFISPQRYRTTV